MIQDNVIYTNGRDVTVTDSTLEVRSTTYRLKGIIKYSFSVLRSERVPCIFLLILSVVLMVCGFLNTFPNPEGVSLSHQGQYYGINLIAIYIGGFLSLIAILLLAVLKERYSLRISTAEGDKDAVVSPHKEYISQIVDALNRATMRYINPAKRNMPGKRVGVNA